MVWGTRAAKFRSFLLPTQDSGGQDTGPPWTARSPIIKEASRWACRAWWGTSQGVIY